MANNIWDNSDADNDGNNANNWSLGWVPKAGDVMVFDSGTTNDNCTFTGNISCDGITFLNAYTGTIDAATHDFTLGTSGLDCTNGGSATLDFGTGTWTSSGDFDFEDIGTAVDSAFTFIANGTGLTIKVKASMSNWDIQISENASFGGLQATTCQDLTIDATKTFTTGRPITIEGSLTINGALSVTVHYIYVKHCPVTIGANGSLTGLGTAYFEGETGTPRTLDITGGGTVDVATLIVRSSYTFSGGTYGSASLTFNSRDANATLTLGTAGGQTLTFTGDVTFESEDAGTYTIDANTHDPDVEFQGDVTLTETIGAFGWTKGSGAISFTATSGTQTYTDGSGAVQDLGDVDHNGAGGTLQLATEMECDDFTGIAGTFDGNGQTLDCGGNLDWQSGYLFDDPVGSTFEVAGNFTADANDLSGASNTWTLSVTGTAVASGAGDVAHSDASGGTEIDASGTPWTDSGNNTNWNFGAGGLSIPIAMHHYTKNIAAA